jgi:choline dehydrogenase-like flavoprotein
VWAVARDLDGIAEFAYRHLGPDRWPLYALSEPTPQSDSRVSLGEDKDRLGQRRVRLDWRLIESDKRTVATLAQTLATEVARLGIGRVRIDDWLLDSGSGWSSDFEGGGHHMGTTRMADDPTKGVVDADCRVHHVDNLFVGGSSVFPTCGSCNPTLTIVALSLRLADHLRPRLGTA